jgi:hypothetical protein
VFPSAPRGWLLGAILFTLASPSEAASQLFGSVGPQSRLFVQQPLAVEQPRWVELSLSTGITLEADLADRVSIRAVGFGRLAESGSERSHADVHEALLLLSGDALTADVGIGTVFWGVTESRHLVDVVNQKDYLEDFDGEAKLGQPMVRLGYRTDGLGFVELFAMTGFRALRFPSRGTRPGAPVPVDDVPRYGSGRDRWSPDWAVRWTRHVGAFDWALSYFHGTSREPQLLPSGTLDEPSLVLFHDLIDQGGAELQWTRGDWLWKGEAMVRGGQGPAFAAFTLGFEHTSWGVFGTDVDLGSLVEVSYDGRDNATFNVYDEDVFAGLRLSLNDVAGTEVLAGVLTDLESGSSLGSVEASRRLGSGWTVELVGRVFASDDPDDPIHWFRRDDHLQTAVRYYF